MRYLNLILILLGMVSGRDMVSAQENNYTVVYDFHVHYPEQLQDGKIQIEVLKGGINTRFSKNLDFIELEIQDSITRVVVPIPDKISYLRLGSVFGRLEGSESLIDLHVGNNMFLVENNDSIEVHIYPKKISPILFKGKQADKYSLQYSIAQKIMINHNVFNEYRTNLEQRRFKDSFSVLQHWVDSAFTQISERLNTSSLPAEIKKLLICDYTAFLYDTKRTLMQGWAESSPNDTEVQQAILAEVSIPRYPIKDFVPGIGANSIAWADMLLYQEWLKFAIENHPDRVGIVKDNDFGFANYIAERYTGIIRDKLFYLALMRQWDTYGLRRVATPILKYNIFAEGFRNLSNRMEGAVMFDMEMQDKDGSIHRFADYKGKVLIIDMWYTGCMPCMALAKQLKAMQKEISQKEDVVFISISFDKYKDIWIKSLESGDYTSDEGLNLWVGQAAFNHPIIAYYAIQGFPVLMVVDKEGKLVERSAIRPLQSDLVRWNEFKKMVESYR